MMTTRRKALLATYSPLLWPVVFLIIALGYFQGVPQHYHWDIFTYLDAAQWGLHYAGLGFGRSPFCWLGQGLFFVTRNVPGVEPELFTLFRAWTVSGIVLLAFAMGWLGIVLPRRIGLTATHLGLAGFALHFEQILLFHGVWPENWSVILLLVAFAILCSRRLRPEWRLGLSLVAAVLMVLMKEIAVYYLPALTVAVLWSVPNGWGWWRRLLAAGVWGLLAGAVPLGTFFALPYLLEGLRESQENLVREHAGLSGTGLSMLPGNAQALLEVMGKNGVLTVLAIAGVVRGFAGLWSRRARQFFLPALSVALLLFVVPLLLIAAAGADFIMNRYYSALAPGQAALVALLFARPVPGLLLKPLPACATVVLLGLLLFRGAAWEDLRFVTNIARHDKVRYEHMELLADRALGIAGGDDCWPAHFVARHHRPGPGNVADWGIFWPGWGGPESRYPVSPEWLESQRVEGRDLAISPSVERHMGRPMDQFLGELNAWEFEMHPSGWHLGTLTATGVERE